MSIERPYTDELLKSLSDEQLRLLAAAVMEHKNPDRLVSLSVLEREDRKAKATVELQQARLLVALVSDLVFNQVAIEDAWQCGYHVEGDYILPAWRNDDPVLFLKLKDNFGGSVLWFKPSQLTDGQLMAQSEDVMDLITVQHWS